MHAPPQQRPLRVRFVPCSGSAAPGRRRLTRRRSLAGSARSAPQRNSFSRDSPPKVNAERKHGASRTPTLGPLASRCVSGLAPAKTAAPRIAQRTDLSASTLRCRLPRARQGRAPLRVGESRFRHASLVSSRRHNLTREENASYIGHAAGSCIRAHLTWCDESPPDAALPPGSQRTPHRSLFCLSRVRLSLVCKRRSWSVGMFGGRTSTLRKPNMTRPPSQIIRARDNPPPTPLHAKKMVASDHIGVSFGYFGAMAWCVLLRDPDPKPDRCGRRADLDSSPLHPARRARPAPADTTLSLADPLHPSHHSTTTVWSSRASARRTAPRRLASVCVAPGRATRT